MANWLQFDKIELWDSVVITGFQYDEVPDADIQAALDSPHLHQVNTALDWEDDTWLSEHATIPPTQKHAYRVAGLVADMRAGNGLATAIELDTFAMRCCSCVPNGHHRVRALQFLGLPCGPFSLSGHLTQLGALVRLAQMPCPPEFTHFFRAFLLLKNNQDVRVSAKR